MYKRYLLVLCSLVSCLCLRAQDFFAYSDTFGFLYTYNDGVFKRMEDRAVKSYKFGTSYTAYVTVMDEFKISFASSNQMLINNVPESYVISREMLGYKFNSDLYVYWNKRNEKICPRVFDYEVYDSLVVFHDRVEAFRVYYDGLVYNLEQMRDSNHKAKANILAYNSQQGFFKMFYGGTLKKLESYAVSDYGVGQNIVAYVDGNNNFKIVDRKKVILAEEIRPQKYVVGYNIVLYFSALNEFKIYYNGEIYTVEKFAPENWVIKDNLVVWQDRNRIMKVFDAGEVIELENYWPQEIKIFNNNLVYKNVYNQPVIYKNKGKQTVYEVVNNITLNGDLKIFYAQINQLVFMSSKGKILRQTFNWKKF